MSRDRTFRDGANVDAALRIVETLRLSRHASANPALRRFLLLAYATGTRVGVLTNDLSQGGTSPSACSRRRR